MSELALYRKYRPQSWKEVKGQEHVTGVLVQSIKDGKVAHAYLFSGPRGTGKTSIARIVARELETSAQDLYEIDGASHNGVDHIRELREEVRTLPFDSKYKVYIIDEVHMLSTSAFNALLKTLEEPPAHVVFILATTELHKVPDTIVSRCQTFSFQKPSQETLADVVTAAAKKEGFKLEASAASLIALLADGAFRDALGVLQKVIAGAKEEKISIEDVVRVTGSPRAELVRSFLRAVMAKDCEQAILVVRDAVKENIEIGVFVKMILREVRMALLATFAPALKKEFAAELSKDEQEFQDELRKEVGKTITSALLKELLDVEQATKDAYIPELPLELALMKFLGGVQK